MNQADSWRDNFEPINQYGEIPVITWPIFPIYYLDHRKINVSNCKNPIITWIRDLIEFDDQISLFPNGE